MTKRKEKEQQLTVKQKKFVDEYIKTGNKTEAAKLAGYATKYADRQANQTLSLDYVKDYYKQEMDKLHKKNIASAEEVLMFYTKMMYGKINERVVAPNSSVVELPANNNERLSAAKELMKHYPNDMVKAQLRKLEAETELTNAKTKMLGNGDKDAEDELGSLIDKMDAIAERDKDDDSNGKE